MFEECVTGVQIDPHLLQVCLSYFVLAVQKGGQSFSPRALDVCHSLVGGSHHQNQEVVAMAASYLELQSLGEKIEIDGEAKPTATGNIFFSI
jgi:hypothetical protein